MGIYDTFADAKVEARYRADRDGIKWGVWPIGGLARSYALVSEHEKGYNIIGVVWVAAPGNKCTCGAS